MSSTTDITAERILIIDFGSQYTQLIARRIRDECGVYSELCAYSNPNIGEIVETFSPSGIILSGGPESVHEEGSPRAPSVLFNGGADEKDAKPYMNPKTGKAVPILGICYGLQTMMAQLGGTTGASSKREFGYAEVSISPDSIGSDPLLAGIGEDSDSGMAKVWMSHGDKVYTVADGFVVTSSTSTCPIASVSNASRQLYGVQFHPEVTHTPKGAVLFKNFVQNICGCNKGLWRSEHIATYRVEQLASKIGPSEHVMLGLSGGVDSSVVAALLHRAIGDRLVCVFVDNGLLRYQEGDQVMAMFAQNMGIRVVRVDAQERFMAALKDVSDPEAKRKIIGKVFIDVFAEQGRLLSGSESIKYLGQGTIYPDIIESAGVKGGGKAHVIKSHHNVGGLPDDLKFSLIEPLRDLFKDEVRKLGLTLGLPHEMLYRHPFPGPGLGVRILGAVNQHYADVLRVADHIFMEELRAADWYDKVSQAFAVFLPCKSVGVVGDARRYAYVISLRAVQTIDFMTAKIAPLPYELIEKVSGRIINEIEDVSRVVYDVSSKPPATIEWE